MVISKQTRERFKEWMQSHEPQDLFMLGTEEYPADQVAELLGLEFPQLAHSINTDVEVENEDMGDSHESGDSEEY